MKRYRESIKEAEKLRDDHKGTFEFIFKPNINLNDYAESFGTGKNNLKLWMTEVESMNDFKRFRGVDLHTWDRNFLDLGENYAYLTVPGKGCVNVVPRFAKVQCENTFGAVKVYCNGIELFN